MQSTTQLLTVQMAADLAPQSRLAVRRSHAYSLIDHEDREDAIIASITDELLGEVELALSGVLAESAPAPAEEIVTHLTLFTALVGQNWSADGRDEFIVVACSQLEQLPGMAMLSTLKAALTSVTDGRLLVPWVFEVINPKKAKLDYEIRMLQSIKQYAAKR